MADSRKVIKLRCTKKELIDKTLVKTVFSSPEDKKQYKNAFSSLSTKGSPLMVYLGSSCWFEFVNWNKLAVIEQGYELLKPYPVIYR